MAKQDWGSKRVCQSCAIKFYDFGRMPIVCPKCGTAFDPETLLKSRRSKSSAASKPVKAVVKPPVPAKDEDEDDIDLGDDDIAGPDDSDDADDAVLEDASDLEDDDVTKVVGAADGDKDEER